jgi:hypothetical protein
MSSAFPFDAPLGGPNLSIAVLGVCNDGRVYCRCSRGQGRRESVLSTQAVLHAVLT